MKRRTSSTRKDNGAHGKISRKLPLGRRDLRRPDRGRQMRGREGPVASGLRLLPRREDPLQLHADGEPQKGPGRGGDAELPEPARHRLLSPVSGGYRPAGRDGLQILPHVDLLDAPVPDREGGKALPGGRGILPQGVPRAAQVRNRTAGDDGPLRAPDRLCGGIQRLGIAGDHPVLRPVHEVHPRRVQGRGHLLADLQRDQHGHGRPLAGRRDPSRPGRPRRAAEVLPPVPAHAAGAGGALESGLAPGSAPPVHRQRDDRQVRA